MKIVALFVCLFGTAFALPLNLLLGSASASNELLLGRALGLTSGALLPAQQQMGALNQFIPPIFELIQRQRQSQSPGLPQIPLAAQTPFAARLTNQNGLPAQVPFPGQGQISQPSLGTQQGQLDPMQAQQTQGMPYIVSYGMPPRMDQMLPYFSTFMNPQQQPGQQQPLDQNMFSFAQFGYVPQRGGSVMPGGQQQPMPNDLLPGGVPVTQTMPAGNVVPHFPNEVLNFGNVNPGALKLLPSHTPFTPDALTSTTNPTVDPLRVDDKGNTNLMNEP